MILALFLLFQIAFAISHLLRFHKNLSFSFSRSEETVVAILIGNCVEFVNYFQWSRHFDDINASSCKHGKFHFLCVVQKIF